MFNSCYANNNKFGDLALLNGYSKESIISLLSELDNFQYEIIYTEKGELSYLYDRQTKEKELNDLIKLRLEDVFVFIENLLISFISECVKETDPSYLEISNNLTQLIKRKR